MSEAFQGSSSGIGSTLQIEVSIADRQLERGIETYTRSP